MSKLREGSSTFEKLIPNIKNNVAGIIAVHLPTKSKYGSIMYDSSLDEIYDVHILKGKTRPNILNTLTNYKDLINILKTNLDNDKKFICEIPSEHFSQIKTNNNRYKNLINLLQNNNRLNDISDNTWNSL